MSESKTRKSLIWIIGGVGAAVIAAMIIVKIWFAATVFMPIEEEVVVTEPLDPEEQIVRDMVEPVVPGTPVMPTASEMLDPSDYSRDLARFIPIEIGMDRYLAKDELLLYYNSQMGAEGAMRTKVSSNERMLDGGTLYVIRRSGMADDSLAAEETYALFDADTLVDFGSRIQCRRGDNANEWTTTLCP